MSAEILDKVKNFLIRLVKDKSFRHQLMSEKVEEVKRLMVDGGFNFSQEEFEIATIQILELKELGHFEELSEEELVGAIGGLRYNWPPKEYPYPTYPPYSKPFPRPQPIDEPIDKPIDIYPQPLYGVIIGPPVQAMYGVVVSEI
ncbi:MAG: Nif11-like leader peptide family RiPP precursor [Xenococcus sp. MO_188.B8]|nr:Nif11-like leader peptide family RiPP precursor [Xenococcus sp. MO_188.B8]